MNLKKYYNSKNKIWLNIASGKYTLSEYLNIDNSPFLKFLPLYPMIKPFVKAAHKDWFDAFKEAKKKHHLLCLNCSRPLPVPDNSVDHILSSHFIEHLYFSESKILLKNWFNILKPSGSLHIIVPDIWSRSRGYTSGRVSAEKFQNSLLLRKQQKPSILFRSLDAIGSFGLEHKWMYDEPSMKSLLIESGFVISPNLDCPSKHWRAENGGQVNIVVIKP